MKTTIRRLPKRLKDWFHCGLWSPQNVNAFYFLCVQHGFNHLLVPSESADPNCGTAIAISKRSPNTTYKTTIERFRSAFTVNVDVTNNYVTLSAGYIYSELLTFRTPGTTFRRKCILVSFLLSRGFHSMFPCLV